jgi:hypothetical protein
MTTRFIGWTAASVAALLLGAWPGMALSQGGPPPDKGPAKKDDPAASQPGAQTPPGQAGQAQPGQAQTPPGQAQGGAAKPQGQAAQGQPNPGQGQGAAKPPGGQGPTQGNAGKQHWQRAPNAAQAQGQGQAKPAANANNAPVPPPPGKKVAKKELKVPALPASKIAVTASKNDALNRRGRPFRADEFKHPQTGRALAPDDEVTLTFKHGKAPVKLTGKQFLDEMNKLEAKLNAQGHSLRDKQYNQETKLDGARMRAAQQAAGETSNKKPIRMLKQAVGAADLDPRHTNLDAVKQGAAAHAQAMGQTAPALVQAQALKRQPRPLPNTLNSEWKADLGDTSVVGAKLKVSTALSGDMKELVTKTGASASIYLFGNGVDLVNVQGTTASHAPGAAAQRASFTVTSVGGLPLVPAVNSSGAAIAVPSSGSGDESIGVDYGVDMYFSLGPVPMHARIGATGSAGVRYSLAASSLFGDVTVVPYLDTKAYATCGVDLLIAEGGVGVDLTLLKQNLEMATRLEIASANGEPEYRWDYHATNTMNALSGKLYAYAEVDYLLDTWEGQWTIFDWPGLQWQAELYRYADKAAVFGAAPIVAAPPPSSGSVTQPASWSKNPCPDGHFKTTGSHHGCDCRPGQKKHYDDILKYKAHCK